MALTTGIRVAWSHSYATQHIAASIVRASAVPIEGDGPGCGQRGTITAVANDEGTWFDVELDNGDTITLTSDEIVEIDETDDQ